MIANLGRILTILATAEAREMDFHADVSAWGAPSECHASVSRGEAQRQRRARKQAEAEARRPLRIIQREARRRGGVALHPACRPYGRLIGALLTFP